MHSKSNNGQPTAPAQPLRLTLAQLEALSDDPARDQPGGVNVRALLTFNAEDGYFLSAKDGNTIYQVVDDAGNQVRYRTMEDAIYHLHDISGLDPEISVFAGAQRGGGHH